MSINVIGDKCTGCRKCLRVCLFEAITISEKIAQIGDNCTLCGECEKICPFNAIIIERRKNTVKNDYKNIWIYAEKENGRIHPSVFELIGAARSFGTKLGKTAALVFGHDQKQLAELAGAGAQIIYCLTAGNINSADALSAGNALCHAVNLHKPAALIASATLKGREMIPYAAVKLETGLTADCTELGTDENGLLLQKRPAFGGNIFASILCRSKRPQMATVRPHVFKKFLRIPDPAASAEIIAIKIPDEILKNRIQLKKRITEQNGENLHDAKIIIAAGRGIKNKNHMKLITALAEALGGSVGVTRSVVEEGWFPYSHQIGQTGLTVQPKLYIACGISGAVQHLAGMQNSETIIAINKDPEAPILRYADYAFTGDLFEIIPEIIKNSTEQV